MCRITYFGLSFLRQQFAERWRNRDRIELALCRDLTSFRTVRL